MRDVEIGAASSYLTRGSSNDYMVEMDGSAGQTSILAQDFTTGGDTDAVISFQTALRNRGGNAVRNVDGFTVEIRDAAGNLVYSQNVYPQTTTMQTYSVPVSLEDAGTYRIRFVEVGNNDSVGAMLDNVSLLVCFTAGTMIRTDRGERPVEDLAAGDMVWTSDHGFQPLIWTGSRTVTAAEQQADARLRPVVFEAGSLGEGPVRPMALSPQHRLCVGGAKVQLHFAQDEVLVPAIALVNGDTIRQAAPADVTYVHILFADHQIVRADGVPSESFQPTALSLGGLDLAARAEVLRLFPELARQDRVQAARPALRMSEARLVA